MKLRRRTVRNVATAIEGLLNAIGEQQALLTDIIEGDLDAEEIEEHLEGIEERCDGYLLLGQELVHELRRRAK
jgi:hypothetical protein